MKIYKFSVVLLVLLFACSTTQQVNISNQTEKSIYSVQDLLEQLPAADVFEEDLILYSLCMHGQSGIVKALVQLESEEYDNAKYAMHGLTRYFSKASAGHKILIQNAFLAVLQKKLNVENKALLIGELHKIADEKAIPVLAPFLKDENLCDPAARALVTIGTPDAGNVLLLALESAADQNKASIIQALGELKFKPAIAQISANSDKDLKEIAVRALANIGDISSGPLIKKSAVEGVAYQEYYLNYANNLASVGHNRGPEICREILAGKEFPNIKLGALAILLDSQKEKAADDLINFYENGETWDRIGLLRIVEKLNNDTINQRFLNLLMSSTPELTSEIIGLFERQKNIGVASSLLRFLSSESADVRLITVDALSTLWENVFTEKMLYYLEFPMDLKKNQNANIQPTDRKKIEFAKLAQDTQNSILQKLVDSRSEKALPIYRKLAISGEKDLRSIAISGLGFVGKKDDLDLLLSALLDGASQEKREGQISFAKVVGRAKNQREVNKELQTLYTEMSLEDKLKLLPTFRVIGDNNSLNIINKAVLSPKQNETAVNVLAAWSNTNAIDSIIEQAETTKNPENRNNLIRGAVRMMNQNKMGDIRSFEYCQRLMTVANKTNQKSMIISQMGNINHQQTVRYLAHLLSDDELDIDAAQAIVKIAKNANDIEMDSPQIVSALVKGSASKSLSTKLLEMSLVENKQNRPPRGFVPLFNGKDLSGWKGLVADPPKRAAMSFVQLETAQKEADEDMRKHWKVVDGVLYFDGKGHSLCTAKDYTNFEMLVDWKIEEHGDSGIYLRGAPQVQIWDTADWPVGSGALYNNQKNPRNPLAVADNPVGEWNTFRIIMKGERVTVYLNDVLVVDSVLMENYWQRDIPIYPDGQLELQAHNTPLYFRNVFIRELPGEKSVFSGPIFNGKDLTGWQGPNGAPHGWQADNGILYTNSKSGGYIFTDKEYSDFELDLEFRLPENGNSGVGIRTPLKGDPAYAGMEIQVLDDYGDKYTQLQPWQYTGSIYAVKAPSKRATKKASEWQTMKIICNGPKVDVFVNGEHTIDANLIDHLDRESSHPGLKNRKGYIGFQNHSTKIEYRNINLKEL
jgi:HEAT repeat protein